MNNIVIIIASILYGTTMKIADLHNEHGLKIFKGSNILFGFLWGLFGTILISTNQIIANIILAMNIAFIMRNRLDYFNHQLAATMIIIAFLFISTFDYFSFSIFFLIFLLFGSIKDYLDDVLKKKKGLFAILSEAMLYYPIPTLIFCTFYGNWEVFWSFLIYTISYDITKLIAAKKGFN